MVEVSQPMRVVRARLYQFEKEFAFGFHSAHTIRKQTETLILQLQFNNGLEGYGESAPRAYVTGETLSDVKNIIRHAFSPLLFSNEISNINDVKGLIDQLEAHCHNSGIYQINSALGALDMALLDALGKLEDVPVSHFLGPILSHKRPDSISVPLLSAEIIETLFQRLPKARFRRVKVLMGDQELENIERAKLVRSLFGKNVEIRVEANGQWEFEQAVSNLENLKKLSIEAAEQPLPKEDLDGLEKLRKAVTLPIIADESVCTLSDAKKIIEKKACDIINIKISKCGGLLRSKQIADMAQARKIGCQLGAHVGETDILIKAGEHFASTSQDLAYFEGGFSFLFDASLMEGPSKRKEKNDSNCGLGIDSKWKKSIKPHCTLHDEITPENL